MSDIALPVRLSSWVYFVDYRNQVRIHHVLSGQQWDVSPSEADEIKQFTRFLPPRPNVMRWIECGVLVAPGVDVLVPRGPLQAEASASRTWTDWYWNVEAESEREYQWMGESLLKMPDDLFLFQEVMHETRARRVLEIGYGPGGSLWFFGHILQAMGGGQVVAVDWDPPERVPAFEKLSTTRFDRVHADAHDPRTLELVRSIAGLFDLVVIDADPSVEGKLALLRQWSSLVAPGGALILEDVTTPEFVSCEAQVSDGLDQFLLDRPEFGVMVRARRFVAGKATRAAYMRAPALQTTMPATSRETDTIEKDATRAHEIRAALLRDGFYYCWDFGEDSDGQRLRRLASQLGSARTDGDVDPADLWMNTCARADADWSSPFDRGDALGWHNDFSSRRDRPDVSLLHLCEADPAGPLHGAWRVASVDRVLAVLRGSEAGIEAIKLLSNPVPFGFDETMPLEWHPVFTDADVPGQACAMRYYGRIIRAGLEREQSPGRAQIHAALDEIERAADRVGHVICAPVGALLVVDNRASLHDRLEMSVNHPTGARRSRLGFVWTSASEPEPSVR